MISGYILRDVKLVATGTEFGRVVIDVFNVEHDAWSDVCSQPVLHVDLEEVRSSLFVVESFVHSDLCSRVYAPVVSSVATCDPVFQGRALSLLGNEMNQGLACKIKREKNCRY